jgi:hypothetical protein
MKFTLPLTILASLSLVTPARALDEQRLLRAIERAEGGVKARKPFGILSVPVRNRSHAREVALRTIRRALRDWDGRGDPIVAIGRRYCPPSVDPVGHRNWVSNVRHFMRTQP